MKKIIALLLSILTVATLSVCVLADEYPNDSSWMGDENKKYFYDVTNDKWYAEFANEAYHRGLFVGTHPNDYVRVFLPDDLLTREQAVALLNRIEEGSDIFGYEPGPHETGFVDAPNDAWYSYYVQWAKTNGITTGITDSLFGIGNAITREELATLIARYVNFRGVSLIPSDSAMEAFADEDEVSYWARDAVDLMRTSGILLGDEKGNVKPQDKITRAEAAAMFIRLDSLLVFEVSELLDFSDDDVVSVKFSEHNFYLKKVIEITDPDEVREVLKDLRSIKIAYSETNCGINGGGEYIGIYDENGDVLFSIRFTPDSFFIDSVRTYFFDSAYLQKYHDMLAQKEYET